MGFPAYHRGLRRQVSRFRIRRLRRQKYDFLYIVFWVTTDNFLVIRYHGRDVGDAAVTVTLALISRAR